jgi:cell shape-determining protein MreC
MKTALFLSIVGALVLALGHAAQSQAPAAPQTPLQRLQSMKAKNKELIDRQAETLKKLDELQLEAQQLKFLGKRS